MRTTTKHPRRLALVAGRCARCRKRQPHHEPNALVIVDYRDTGTIVAKVMRDGSRHSATNTPDSAGRARFEPIRPGRGSQLECPDCGAEPRRSRRVLLRAADDARANGRDLFYVGD